MDRLDKNKITRRTSLYVKDFNGMLETLQFRIRFKLESLSKGRTQVETREQLEWALGVCEQIRERHDQKMPFPVGSLTYVMGTTWPPESELRDEFVRLEKAYPVSVK